MDQVAVARQRIPRRVFNVELHGTHETRNAIDRQQKFGYEHRHNSQWWLNLVEIDRHDFGTRIFSFLSQSDVRKVTWLGW